MILWSSLKVRDDWIQWNAAIVVQQQAFEVEVRTLVVEDGPRQDILDVQMARNLLPLSFEGR